MTVNGKTETKSALKRISELIGKYMAVIVLAAAALSLAMPACGLWIPTSWINILLMIIMFGMGLTLDLNAFAEVFRNPKDILCGCIAQFTIMPLLAYLLGKLFGLDEALLAGVILVGTCPGGTSSNVITYLSRGDVALSVGMTSVNTLLAPLLTPAITWLLLRTSVTVDAAGMFFSIIRVVIIPIALGFVISRYFGRYTARIIDGLPALSVAAITMIVMSVVSHNARQILAAGGLIFTVVILHNLLGYAAGFLLAKILKLPVPKQKALSIEIGMQNSGLAVSLAATAFPNLALAAVPGAVFSVWHNISGAVLAGLFRRME